MIKFLIALLITLVVFTPACLFASNIFFRVSAQAERSFEDFSTTILQLEEEANLGDSKSFVLIMDDQTYVAKFTANKNIVYPEPGRALFETTVFYPPQCGGKDCLVLCTMFEVTGTVEKNLVRCENSRVTPLTENQNIEDFIMVRSADEDAHSTVQQRRRFVTMTQSPSAGEPVVLIQGDTVLRDSDASLLNQPEKLLQVQSGDATLRKGETRILTLKATPILDLIYYTELSVTLSLQPTAGLLIPTTPLENNDAAIFNERELLFRFPVEGQSPGSYELRGMLSTVVRVPTGVDTLTSVKVDIPVTWKIIVNEE